MTTEVANAFWIAVKMHRFLEVDARSSLEALGDMNLSLIELSWAQISQVLKIACKVDLTVYDASYLFLADQMDAQFVTADDKLYKKAKEAYNVLHIKDY